MQFRRFRQAVRLIHCLACFEGLLSRAMLFKLALSGLVASQCLPYLRGALAVTGGNGFHLAIARLEAVATALPTDWFQGRTMGHLTTSIIGRIRPLFAASACNFHICPPHNHRLVSSRCRRPPSRGPTPDGSHLRPGEDPGGTAE